MRYLEDFHPGDLFESPGITLTESEIIRFALQFDPQPFHVDVEAAAQSPAGGLIASGFQTVALGFRMLFDTGLFQATLGSPGMDRLEWLKPVRPGDTLRTRMEVIESRPSRSKPDRGLLTGCFTILDQRNELMVDADFAMFMRRKGQPA